MNSVTVLSRAALVAALSFAAGPACGQASQSAVPQIPASAAGRTAIRPRDTERKTIAPSVSTSACALSRRNPRFSSSS